jgi:hypothetical protein
MNEKLKTLGRVLSKKEQKKISGGEQIVLCGGTGNYIEQCDCRDSQGTLIGPFFCCHNGESDCITTNCGFHYRSYVCTKYNPS